MSFHSPQTCSSPFLAQVLVACNTGGNSIQQALVRSPTFTCTCAAWSPFQLSAGQQVLSLSPTLSCSASFKALCIIQFQLSKKCRPAHSSHIILHVPSYTVFLSHSLLTVSLPGSRSLGSCHSLSLEHCNLWLRNG